MLSPGDRLGPYEVISALGAGGMGEVYRARDTRLGRDVALKVLHAEVASDPDRLKRFEREARALAALEHPNILTLHDVGSDQGRPHLIFELVEGQTLRQKLGNGPFPIRKAVDYAVQVCRGLAAAHSRGIVHRDLKPENLSLTHDGRVKILDFGLARLTAELQSGSGENATASTESGVALGTVGYMSPEQVRCKQVDARSDLFSLGAVLYEMVSGRRAFDGATSADRMSAVLTADPPEPTAGADATPPLLVAIVRRCLEKDADNRFQTARDLGFALEGLALEPHARSRVAEARERRVWYAVGGFMLVALAAATLWRTSPRPAPLPTFEQLTFRRGMVLDARFTADGNTVVYGGLFDGLPAETYSLHLSRKESLRLELPPVRLFGVSSTGELAVVMGRRDERRYSWSGTLARVPLAGGAPRQLVDDVFAADWSHDGRELAAIRLVDGEYQLEYPLGRVLRRPLAINDAGFAMRVSPDGNHVAHTGQPGVTVIDRMGQSRVLPATMAPMGLAWDPSGRAVWVGLNREGRQSTGLWRIGLDGGAREAARFPGLVMVHDVSRDGRVLVHVGFERGGVRATAPAGSLERDLCPFSWCQNPKLGPDGMQLVLWDWTVNPVQSVDSGWCYLRSTSGGPAARLGEGSPLAMSPDGAWVLVSRPSAGGPTLELLPTGSGPPRRLNSEGLSRMGLAWMSQGNEVFVVADDSSGERRTFLIGHEGARPIAVTPAGARGLGGPVNNRLLASTSDGTLAWYPLSGGEPLAVGTKRQPGTNVAGLSADGRFLFEGELGVPGRIHRLDLATRQRVLWKVVQPDDPAGFVGAFQFAVSRDGRAYAYGYLRLLQDLYLVDGVR